jgi:maleylpyruvate isomerase
VEQAREWSDQGWVRFDDAVSSLDDAAWDAPSSLPGWTRKHLVAHVAANADALSNLYRWAATGIETPMYTSSAQRAADIEAGSHRSPAELRDWLLASARRYDEAARALTPEQWSNEVRTAQGREVSAREIPWMRAREVMVHAVDLAVGIGFDDLPSGFLLALVDDIVARRSTRQQVAVTLTSEDRTWTIPGEGPAIEVSGSLADVVAYAAGRRSAAVAGGGQPLPALSAWL